MCLQKHYHFDKYTLISKDTGNECTLSLKNAISVHNTYAQWETID